MINGTQFINGRRWVDTYYNGRKVAGSQIVDVSGEMLSVPNTYDDTAWLKIYGKTVESGEGEKYPDNPYELQGVENPTVRVSGKNLLDISNYVPRFDIVYNPAMPNQISLNGTSASRYIDFNVFVPANTQIQVRCESSTDVMQWYMLYYDDTLSTSYANGWSRLTQKDVVGIRIYGLPANHEYTPCTLSNITLYIDVPDSAVIPYEPFRGMTTIHFPHTLRSLPDGTCDYIEIDDVAKTAKLYRSIGEKVFNGTEKFSSDYQGTEYFRVYSVLSTMTNATLSSAICSHFPYGGYYQITNENFSTTPFISPVVAFIVKRSTVGATTGNTTAELITLFKSWLADQYNNGTPVTVQYKLATPEVIELDYNAVKTYYPYTQIYTTATVQPTLEAKIRVWEA